MFVADLHNDVLQRSMIGEDISELTFEGHSDLIRLSDSCIDLEVFVVWIPEKKNYKHAFKIANEMYDKMFFLEQKENLLKIPSNLEDILKSKKNKILSAPIAIEGGEPLENKIENLYHFINRGLFYFGPTWNNSLSWVSSNFDEKYNKQNIKSFGLNKFGEEVIKVCNDNGVIVDVSHIGEKSFWDIAKISSKPFIASHSSVYNLCPHFRNLKDDQILSIKKSEGLIGLNPYPLFIDSSFSKRQEELRKKISYKIEQIYSDEKKTNAIWIKKQHLFQKEMRSIAPSVEVYIDHIEYIINLVGVDYVAIGSDYDGLDSLPYEMNDCRDHIIIAEKLESRNYSHKDVEKVMGLNLLRVIDKIKN